VKQIYTRTLELLIGACLTIMIGVGFASVIARYFFGNWLSLYWAEEVIRYAFIWSVFLASPLVIRRGANLELDILVQWVAPSTRRAIALFNSLIILAFLAVLIVQGIRMVQVNVAQLSSALEYSMAWVYAAVPTGGVLMAGEYAAVLFRLIRSRAGTSPTAHPVAAQ
jgi:TRAP-type C4-dicarboxylate transport system permease small subunit